MAFEHHRGESLPGWRKAGRQRGGQGQKEEGRQGRLVWRLGPEDRPPGRVLGRFPPPPPATTSAPGKGTRPHLRCPETPRFELPLRRSQESTSSPAQGRSPPAPGTRVLSAEKGAPGVRKRPRQNSPRPPEKPTTPPASLSPRRPPRPSAQAPAGFPSAPSRLGRDAGESGSEWGCAR